MALEKAPEGAAVEQDMRHCRSQWQEGNTENWAHGTWNTQLIVAFAIRRPSAVRTLDWRVCPSVQQPLPAPRHLSPAHARKKKQPASHGPPPALSQSVPAPSPLHPRCVAVGISPSHHCTLPTGHSPDQTVSRIKLTTNLQVGSLHSHKLHYPICACVLCTPCDMTHNITWQLSHDNPFRHMADLAASNTLPTKSRGRLQTTGRTC